MPMCRSSCQYDILINVRYLQYIRVVNHEETHHEGSHNQQRYWKNDICFSLDQYPRRDCTDQAH
jgi:hypothetical protein